MGTLLFKTVNKEVACTPFVTRSIEPQRQASGFITAAPRTNLVALTVLAAHESLGLLPGSQVYVPQEFANSAWGKKVMKLDGVGEFILVPADQIYLTLPVG
jgi:hypothetical protein